MQLSSAHILDSLPALQVNIKLKGMRSHGKAWEKAQMHTAHSWAEPRNKYEVVSLEKNTWC